MASVRAGRPVPSCDASDDADGVEIQTRQMIEWAMTGFLPSGPSSLDPPEGKQTLIDMLFMGVVIKYTVYIIFSYIAYSVGWLVSGRLYILETYKFAQSM